MSKNIVVSIIIIFLCTGCSSSSDTYCENLQSQIRAGYISLQNLPDVFDKEYWEDDEKAFARNYIEKNIERLEDEADSIACYG